MLHLPLLLLEIGLNHFKVGILNLALSKVKIVPVLTIKPYRIPAFAIAKGVMRNALPSKNVCKRLRFVEKLPKVVLYAMVLLFLVSYCL